MTLRQDKPVRTSQGRSPAQVPLSDMVFFLKEHLGPNLLRFMVERDDKTISRWIEGANTPRDLEIEARIRAAYQVFDLLTSVEASPTIRAWFMGMNSQLEDLSPAEALKSNQLREVLAAARSFRDGA